MPTDPKPEPLGLHRKMAAVMGDVGRIPKLGYNPHFHYHYVREPDLVEELTEHLARRGLMIYPSVVGVREVPRGSTSSGKKLFLTVADMEFLIVDGETGESVTRRWVGYGIDDADKGLYKSMTGAVKYFLMKTFLVSTGDDPEAGTANGAPAAEAPAQSTGRGRGRKAAEPTAAPEEKPAEGTATPTAARSGKKDDKPPGFVPATDDQWVAAKDKYKGLKGVMDAFQAIHGRPLRTLRDASKDDMEKLLTGEAPDEPTAAEATADAS